MKIDTIINDKALKAKAKTEMLSQFVTKHDASSDSGLLAACLAVLNTNEFIYID